MGDPIDSIFKNPEEYVLITDMDQIVGVYPELFEHATANPSPYFQTDALECEVEVYKGQNRRRPRYILFNSGIVSLDTLGKRNV